MEACNSHKCHCPRCMASRGVKADIDLNHRIDQRVDMRLAQHERDQLRREDWKQRAARHHIDQAGVCTGESECPCPNCREYREFYRLRLGERVSAECTSDMMTESRTDLPEEFFTMGAIGRVVKWFWARRPGGWCRKDVHTRRIFGPFVRHVDPSARYVEHDWQFASRPLRTHHIRTRTVGDISIRDEVIIHETNPVAADNWVKSKFISEPTYVSPEEATELYRKWYFSSVSTINAVKRKEHPVLTPLQLAILSHRLAHPNVPYPHEGRVTSEALNALIESQMLEHDPCCPSTLRLTGRAKVLMEAILALPLPVRKPAPWTMPS